MILVLGRKLCITRIPARWVQAIIPPLNYFSFLLTHRTVMSAASWPRLILWGRISDNSDKYSTCIDIFMKLNEETRRGAHTSSFFNNALIDCDN